MHKNKVHNRVKLLSTFIVGNTDKQINLFSMYESQPNTSWIQALPCLKSALNYIFDRF